MFFDDVFEMCERYKYNTVDGVKLIDAQVFRINDEVDSLGELHKMKTVSSSYLSATINQIKEKQYKKTEGGFVCETPMKESLLLYGKLPYTNCVFCYHDWAFWIFENSIEKNGIDRYTLMPLVNNRRDLRLLISLIDRREIETGSTCTEDLESVDNLVAGKKPYNLEHSSLFPFGIERIDFYRNEQQIFLGDIFMKRLDGSPMPYPINLTLMKLYFVSMVVLFVNLINCSNISTVLVSPSEKLNRARLRRGKLPLFSYKTLVIDSNGFIRRNGQKKASIYSNRIHLCRGHFKLFSPNRPLFGRYSGLYWWQPCVRGKNKNGFVDKEYHVKEACAV